MPVISEIQQREYIGGKKGEYNDPYTQTEFYSMLENGLWNQAAYVSNMGLVGAEVVVTGNISGEINNGNTNYSDYFYFGLDVGSAAGSGSQNILDNRGVYMPQGKIYNLKTPITVRLPIGVVDTSADVLNVVRVGGKIMGILGNAATAYEIIKEHNSGNSDVAAAKLTVALVQAGCTFRPGVGWAIALSIGIADIVWGDDFYNTLK